MSVFARLYILLHTQARLVIAGAVLLVAACGFLAASFAVREDITTLVPQKPAGLAAQFALLRDAPFLRGLTIAVGGHDPASSAQLLARNLRSPDIPSVSAGTDEGLSPSFLSRFCAAVPGLMDEAAMANLPALLDEPAMRDALRRDVRLMRGAQGIALRDLVAMDPLGICAAVMEPLAPHGTGPGLNLGQGGLRSADGRYALVMAKPAASMADSQAAGAVMAKVREAVRALPEDAHPLIVGGYRHTEENAAVIRSDMRRILPVSLALLTLAYLVFVRTWKGLVIVALPGASLAVAAACTGFVHGGISGIVLGFGSVILGISADYAIHVYYAMRSGEDTPDILARLAPPMLFGAATTLAAFLAFFSSSIPCIIQMTGFAVAGIVTAVVLALVVLPHILAAGKPRPGQAARPRARARIRPLPLLCIWGILGGGIAVLLRDVPVNGDIRALSYVSEAVQKDDAALREHFGGLGEQGLFAVKGAAMQETLARNDALWADLRKHAARSGWNSERVTSLASTLPSEATQRSRHKAWETFWAGNAAPALGRLAPMAAEAGFAPEAFSPFRDWIATTPHLVTPALFREGGLDPTAMLTHEGASSTVVYSLVQGDTLPTPVLEILRRHDSLFVSGATFRSAMDEATRSDLLRFGGISLLAILCMNALFIRSPARMGMTLLPVGAALCATLAAFRLAGMELNIFHAMALPLVTCLSVDYGVFILANLEGKLDNETRLAVLLSGITTLSGFGVLLLGKHPALHSLGLSVSVGLTAALLTAFAILPRLAAPTAPPFPEKDATP